MMRSGYLTERCFAVNDVLEFFSAWPVLKWVILVLIAGFIGQFGRMLAEAIIARARLRRVKQSHLSNDKASSEAPMDLTLDESGKALSRKPEDAGRIPDKKTLKILAKIQKKEAKKKE